MYLLKENDDDTYIIDTDSERENITLKKELDETKDKLQLADKRTEEVKLKLKLSPDADHQTVLDRVTEYRKGKKMKTMELDKLMKDYQQVKEEKDQLNKRVRKLEVEVSQQREDYECTSVLKTTDQYLQKRTPRPEAAVTVSRVTIGDHNLPAIKPLTPKVKKREVKPKLDTVKPMLDTVKPMLDTGDRSLIMSFPGCVFCRAPFGPATVKEIPQSCYIHHREFASGNWPCCGGKANNQGCLKMPHMKAEVLEKGRIRLKNEWRMFDLA